MRLLSFGLALALSATACERRDLVATLPPSSQIDAGLADSSVENDGGPTEFCEGSGPPLLVGDTGDPVCGSSVAEKTFRFALCSCTDLVASHQLSTDAFDSRNGPYTTGEVGGSVGTNGGISTNAAFAIGGSLWAAGTNGISAGAGADLNIRADLNIGGPFAGETSLEVARDARIAGRLHSADALIGGTLTLPDGAAIEVSGTQQIANIVRAPVTVESPCTCDQDKLVDIAAYVSRHQAAANNDNDEREISTEALADISTPTTLELDCGKYYFSRASAPAALTLKITGRTSIFIAGDLAVDESFTVELEDGAELDLFVAGNIVSSGPLSFGSFRTPARARLYTGGTGTIQLSGGGTFAGNLYAPRAELVASAPIEVFGSIFVRRLAASAGVTIHYDTAVLRAGEDCEAPPQTSCNSCVDCPDACTQGQCAACMSNDDCCAPLFCVAGRCEASPF